jgi:hypothetical protein
MLIAFEIPSPRRLNQQLDGFSCQWHEFLPCPGNHVCGAPEPPSGVAHEPFARSRTARNVRHMHRALLSREGTDCPAPGLD